MVAFLGVAGQWSSLCAATRREAAHSTEFLSRPEDIRLCKCRTRIIVPDFSHRRANLLIASAQGQEDGNVEDKDPDIDRRSLERSFTSSPVESTSQADSKRAEDESSTCKWCSGSGERLCPWCRGNGVRSELIAPSWDALGESVREAMENNTSVSLPQPVDVVCSMCSGRTVCTCTYCMGSGKSP